MKNIHVARDFSRYPAGRFRVDGPFSGESFRDQCLEPALRDRAKIKIIFDGVRGYGSSFLEEAFGGLRRKGYDKELITENIMLDSEDPTLVQEIEDYINGSDD